MIGFAAYETTRRGFFGPTGVAPSERGKHIGKALLLASLWGLREMGYAQAVVKSDFELPGDEDVLRKVFEDLKGSGVSVTEGDVRMKMAELLAQAREEVKTGK